MNFTTIRGTRLSMYFDDPLTQGIEKSDISRNVVGSSIVTGAYLEEA